MKKFTFLALVAAWVTVGVLGTAATPARAAGAVPLPSTLPLLGLGFALLGVARRKK